MTLDALQDAGFDVLTRNHANAILAHDFPRELELLAQVLSEFRISLEEIITGGGGESGQTQRLRHELSDLNWRKHNFEVQTVVDGHARTGISHGSGSREIRRYRGAGPRDRVEQQRPVF